MHIERAVIAAVTMVVCACGGGSGGSLKASGGDGGAGGGDAGASDSSSNDDSSAVVADEPFSVSLDVGKPEPLGHFLGGTELISLVDFDGKLWAANGYWEDVPGSDPSPGPQIFVLDSPHGAWKQDHAFSEVDANGRLVYLRCEALQRITFTTDGGGTALANPVTTLIVGLDLNSSSGAAAGSAVFTRNDDGSWTQLDTSLATGTSAEVRAFALYKDAVTGVDHLFIGAGSGESGKPDGAIYTGVYDPTAPGRIRVASTPEFSGFANRVMSFVSANGALTFAAKPGLYTRKDGPGASWALAVNALPPPDSDATRAANNSGVRGLTVVGSDVLGGLEGIGGPILRFDPSNGYSFTTETGIGQLEANDWGAVAKPNDYVISAYNDMLAVTDPTTSASVLLLGLQAHDPSKPASAWYVVRGQDGSYGPLLEVPQLVSLSDAGPTKASNGLVAVRTIHVSPFSEDHGQALYFGGHDANFLPAHDTAWLYRVGLHTALHP